MCIRDRIHTGDTNTAIRFPAADTITAETGGSERLRIDSNGQLLVGTTTSGANVRAVFQGYNGGGENYQARVQFQTNQATNLSADHHIANLLFTNASSSVGAEIRVQADAAWGTSDYPTRISFLTTPDGSDTRLERVRINSSGDLGVNNTSPSAKLDVVDDSASGYIAEFRQSNTSNSGQIVIDSPTNSDSRPVLMEFSRAGTLQWSIGQGYNSSGGAFHIANSSLSAGVTGVRASFLAGGGLTFNGDTAAANALDDYEEGTYTPAPTDGTAQSSPTDGQYTKIGTFCIVSGSISLNGDATTAGNMFQFTLPFTAGSGRAGSGVIRYSNNSTASTVTFHVDAGAATVSLYQFGGSSFTYTEASTNRYDFCMTYRTA